MKNKRFSYEPNFQAWSVGETKLDFGSKEKFHRRKRAEISNWLLSIPGVHIGPFNLTELLGLKWHLGG